MAKKKFEETEYDPFERDRLRTLSRQVATPKTSEPEVSSPTPEITVTLEAPQATSNIVSMPKKRVRGTVQVDTFKVGQGNPKSRTFKCSSSAQDKELDSFLSRLKEIAGTEVPFQIVARAAIAATMRAEEQIADVVRKNPSMRRPANVSAAEYAQYEQYWADIVMEALRKVRPYQK